MKDVYYLTAEKYESLKKELDTLTNVTRKEIAEKLEFARSLGDLSENAEYHDARANQAATEGRIREIETILKLAKIVEHTAGGAIEIGSRVVVEKKGSGEKKEYFIVGPEESDLLNGRISNTSPLGKALMGKEKGETFSFAAPGGTIEYKIVDVE